VHTRCAFLFYLVATRRDRDWWRRSAWTWECVQQRCQTVKVRVQMERPRRQYLILLLLACKTRRSSCQLRSLCFAWSGSLLQTGSRPGIMGRIQKKAGGGVLESGPLIIWAGLGCILSEAQLDRSKAGLSIRLDGPIRQNEHPPNYLCGSALRSHHPCRLC
jgi:hypothetical protein